MNLNKKRTVIVLVGLILVVSGLTLILQKEVEKTIGQETYYSVTQSDLEGVMVKTKDRDSLSVKIEDVGYKMLILNVSDYQNHNEEWVLIPFDSIRNYVGAGEIVLRNSYMSGKDERLYENEDYIVVTLHGKSAYVVHYSHFSSYLTYVIAVNGTVLIKGSDIQNGTIQNFFVGKNIANATIEFFGSTVFEEGTWQATTDADFNNGDCSNSTEVYTNKVILKRKEYNDTDDEWKNWNKWNKIPKHSPAKIEGYNSKGTYSSENIKTKDPIINMTLYVNKKVPKDTSLNINLSLNGKKTKMDITNTKQGETFNFSYDKNNTNMSIDCDFFTDNPFTTSEFGGTPIFSGVIMRYVMEDRTGDPSISVNGNQIRGFSGELADGESSGKIQLNISQFKENTTNTLTFYAGSSLDYQITINYTDSIIINVTREKNVEKQIAIYIPSQNGTNINISLYFNMSAQVNNFNYVTVNNTTAGGNWNYVWNEVTGNLTITIYSVTTGVSYYIEAEMFYNNPPKVGHILGKDPVIKGEALGLWDDSTDEDNNDLNHTWDFDDGTFGNSSNPVHIWNEEGVYHIIHIVVEAGVSVNITIYHIKEIINITVVEPECRILDDYGNEMGVFDYNHFSLNETHILSTSWIEIKNGSKLDMKVSGIINGSDAIPSDWNMVFYLYEEFGNVSNYIDYFIVNDTLEFLVTNLNTTETYYLKGEIVDVPDFIRIGKYWGLTGMSVSFDGYSNFNFLTRGTVLNSPPQLLDFKWESNYFSGKVYDINGEIDLVQNATIFIKELNTSLNVMLYDYVFGNGELEFVKYFSLVVPGDYHCTLTVYDKSGAIAGSFRTIVVSILNILPVIDLTIWDFEYMVYESESFSANIYDTDGTIANVTWNFGDGTGGYGSNTTHYYIDDGYYNVVVTARDNYGGETSKNFVVRVFLLEKSLNIVRGWNLICLPISNTTFTASTFVEMYNLTAVTIREKTTGNYHTYVAGSIADFNLEVGTGFYVNSGTNMTIIVKGYPILPDSFNLTKGWNLIGVSNSSGKTVSSVFYSNPDIYVVTIKLERGYKTFVREFAADMLIPCGTGVYVYAEKEVQFKGD